MHRSILKNSLMVAIGFTTFSTFAMEQNEKNFNLRYAQLLEEFEMNLDLPHHFTDEGIFSDSFSETEDLKVLNKREREEETEDDITSSRPPFKRARTQESSVHIRNESVPIKFKRKEISHKIPSFKNGMLETIANSLKWEQTRETLLKTVPTSDNAAGYAPDEFLIPILDSLSYERLLQLWLDLKETPILTNSDEPITDPSIALKKFLITYFHEKKISFDLQRLFENKKNYVMEEKTLNYFLQSPFLKVVLNTNMKFSLSSWHTLFSNPFLKDLEITCEYDPEAIIEIASEDEDDNENGEIRKFDPRENGFITAVFQELINNNNTIQIETLSVQDFFNCETFALIGELIKIYPLKTLSLEGKVLCESPEPFKQVFYEGLRTNESIINLISLRDTLGDLMPELAEILLQRKTQLTSLQLGELYRSPDPDYLGIGLQKLLGGNKDLKVLQLNYCDIEDEYFSELLEKLQGGSFTHLALVENPLTDLSVLADFLKENKHIQYIDLSYNDLSPKSYDVLEKILQENPKLHLSFLKHSRLGITDPEWELIKVKMAHLKKVYGDRVS